jgi:hypothetical protein
VKVRDINALPSRLLEYFGSSHAMVFSGSDAVLGPVVACTSFDPIDLIPVNELKVLDVERRLLGVNSILVCIIKVTEELTRNLGQVFDEFPTLTDEILGLLDSRDEVLSVYIVTYFNPDDRPCGSMTVSVGGDCYGEDNVNFGGILARVSLLAKATASKPTINSPDIPASHVCKKGEWILLDAHGQAIREASEAVRVALASVVIKCGIEFLNRLNRERLRKEMGGAGYDFVNMSPDSASPDSLSGKYWPNLCRAWHKMGLEMQAVCMPEESDRQT